MRCEFLIDGGMNVKGMRMMQAMMNASRMFGISNVQRRRDQYVGDCELLMIYGIGHPIMRHNFKAHIESGRNAIGWDLGYYGRHTGGSYPMRLSLNAPHPQAMMRKEKAGRWESAGIALRNDYRPDGHIVLAGLGRKGRVQFDYDGASWEQETLDKIRAAYPGRTVVYRPKAGATEPLNCKTDATSPIEKVIKGASLVVVRHSNVAIDACIAGIPVVCYDGAAASLYGSDLCNPVNPTEQERLEFLRSLAYWQWRPAEAELAWKFILSRLGLT